MSTVRIYRSKRFTRQLEGLREADGKARLAARRAREIIDALAHDAPFPEAGQLTRYGELRLKKCRKFALGSGYRLLTMVRQGQVLLLYVGTHDDCNQWLENNRGFEPELDPAPVSSESLPPLSGPAACSGEDVGEKCTSQNEDEEADYNQLLCEQLDDAMLRRIFKGICGGR